MKRNKLLALPLIAGLLLSACAPAAPATATGADAAPQDPGQEAPAAVGEPISLTLAEFHPEAHPSTRAHHEFARLVEERSGGSMSIQVFGGGVLGGETAVIEQVQLGATSLTRISAAVLPGHQEAFNALFLPYIWDSREAMFDVLNGDVGQYFSDILEESGMIILAWHDGGARSFYNSVRPIYTPEDLEGLRIRVQEAELMINLIEALGASAVPIPGAEVYTAIQTGVVDGAENNFPTFAIQSHYEVARYFTLNEHTIIPEPILINAGLWHSLSPEQQDILFGAAREAAEYQRIAWLQEEQDSEDHVVANGAIVTRLTPEQRQSFVDLAMAIYDDYTHLQYYIDMIRNAQN